MKRITVILLLSAIFLSTHCSYVSNMADEKLNNHPSFSGTAVYDKSSCKVILSWDDSDRSGYGWDIFKTDEPDEFSDYHWIWSASFSPYNDMVSCSDTGVYYYRLAKYKIGSTPFDDYEEISVAIPVKIE